MARTVEDCAVLDAIATGAALPAKPANQHLKGLRLGFAPRQHLDLIDSEVEACFRGTLARLRDAGAEIIEIDLGEDFVSLALQANWPIFFGETMPHVTEYLQEQRIAASFEEIYEGLGQNVKLPWSDSVVAGAPRATSKEVYSTSMNIQRPELQRRYAEAYRSNRMDALLFPTTPTVAPLIDEQVPFVIAGQVSDRILLAKNVSPSSCAGLPGISLPIGLSSTGLPIGMELDGPRNSDARLLDIAARVSATLGAIPGPQMA